MRIRFVSFTGAVLALLYACTSEPAPRKDPVTRAGHVPECLVKEQRLVLNDGSAICLDAACLLRRSPPSISKRTSIQRGSIPWAE